MSTFKMPKILTNHQGNMRKAGFELEFSNLEIEKAVDILKNSFNLESHKINNYLYKLSSRFGDFTLELDFELLTKQSLKKNIIKMLQESGIEVEERSIDEIEEFVGKLSKDIVPYEMSTPPLPLDELELIEEIVREFRSSDAQGSSDRFYYAFGLHINLELISLESSSILSYLRAYMILQDFLNKDAKVDLSRKITPFIDDFKKDYIKHILDANYSPDITTLIEDYIRFNPTRNRSLDMLPVFAFIDEKRVRAKLKDEKIKPRPTFHYRLSNSMIGDANWRVSDEWNRWNLVERLANDKSSLEELSRKYMKYLDNFINLYSWEDEVREWLQNRS